jgi:cytochrome c oxidase subunit 3
MESTVPDSLPIVSQNGTPNPREKSSKFLLWIGQVSIAMLFAGLTSGYLVRRETGNWMRFEMPFQFWFGTATILLSSITMNWSLSSARRNRFDALPKAVLSTFILGVVFIVFQFLSWSALIKANVYVMGIKSSASGSYLYIISGLHLTHILGGLAALLVVYFKSLKRKYTVNDYLGVKLCSIFWHFLAGLWIYLFIFMLLER